MALSYRIEFFQTELETMFAKICGGESLGLRMRWPTCHCKPAKVFGSIEFLELIHQITQGWGQKTFLFTVNFPDKLERG